MSFALLAQTAAPAGNAGAIFAASLIFIFLTAVITTVVTKWARDKCLKFFHGSHMTLERSRGQTSWGTLKVFSNGLEITYDHPFVDARGRKKTSSLLYQQDIAEQLLSLLRYAGELDEKQRKARDKQIHRTFNPGPFRRMYRGVRNFVNTLRDAFNAAIGAAVGQYQRMNPTSALIGSQSTSVTSIGQTLLGKFANAYEPLLEQYIGQPVILDVADPMNPNNEWVEYTGYLADYTQQYIALFNVEHHAAEQFTLALPDLADGPELPPPPPSPGPGAPAIALPPPLLVEHDLQVRIDGKRLKIHNGRAGTVVIRRLERAGFESVVFGAVLPPNATFDLPARDARGGTLVVEIVSCVDVIAARKFASVRHAGELVERRGLLEELHIDQLPLVPKMFYGGHDGAARKD